VIVSHIGEEVETRIEEGKQTQRPAKFDQDFPTGQPHQGGYSEASEEEPHGPMPGGTGQNVNGAYPEGFGQKAEEKPEKGCQAQQKEDEPDKRNEPFGCHCRLT
jgi:hypothetical protein